MDNTTDSATVEADIIIQQKIAAAWDENKGLREIAEETGLAIDTVSRNLTRMQKEAVKEEG